MSILKKQQFLKLMRLEKILPVEIDRENLGGTTPQELLSLLSFQEFTWLTEDVKAGQAGVKGHNN